MLRESHFPDMTVLPCSRVYYYWLTHPPIHLSTLPLMVVCKWALTMGVLHVTKHKIACTCCNRPSNLVFILIEWVLAVLLDPYRKCDGWVGSIVAALLHVDRYVTCSSYSTYLSFLYANNLFPGPAKEMSCNLSGSGGVHVGTHVHMRMASSWV